MLLKTTLALLLLLPTGPRTKHFTLHVDVPAGNDWATGPTDFSLPGFPSGLGTLDAVHVSITTTAQLSAAVENLTGNPVCAYTGQDLCGNGPLDPVTPPNFVKLELLDREGGLLASHEVVCADVSAALDTFDGSFDFAGPSSAILTQDDSSTKTDAVIITGIVPLAPWHRANLTLSYNRIADVGSGSTAGGHAAHSDTANVAGGFDITYEYH